MKPIYSSKTIRLSAILLFFFVGLTFVRSSGYAGEKPEKDRVVYGGSSWIGHYPVWIGMKRNLFREKGLEIHFRQFYASSARMGAMIAGNLDFASTGSISAIALMASGVRSFFVIGSQDSYATVEGIIAGKEVQTVADLEGKKLGVAFASSAHVLVLDVLERNGLVPKKDVTLINLKVSEMPAAFLSGEVDACAAWTPMFHKLMAMEDAHLLLDDTEFSLFKEFKLGPGPDVLVVRKRFAKKYPNTVRAFLEGYFESVERLKTEPEACANDLMDLTNLSLEDQLQVLKDITWYGLEQQRELLLNPGTFTRGLQKLADFLKKQGQIDRSPEVRKWVKPDLLP